MVAAPRPAGPGPGARRVVVPVRRRRVVPLPPPLLPRRPHPDLLDLLERRDDLGHGGPAPGVPLEAAQRELGRLQRGLGRVLALEPRVDQAGQLPPVGRVRLHAI